MRKAQHAWRTGLIVPFPLKRLLRRLTSHLRQQGPREHTPTLETLISHLLFHMHIQNLGSLSIFACCEIEKKKKRGSSPTHQTRTTCQKAAMLALAQIHHFHTTLTRTPPGHGMAASAGKYAVSLSLSGRQIHSQADTLTSAKTPDPHHLSFVL